MLSSSASVRKRVEEHARSMPSFILDSDSLDNYRPWLRRAREWARKQGGDVMEQHLIGQTVPAEALTDETLAAADERIIGYTADEGVGAEGGRRRQIRSTVRTAKDIAVPRDMVARLVMIHMWIKTEYMLADIGTKFVSQTVYKALVPKMRGIEPIVPSFGTNFKKRPRVQFDGEVKTGI